MKIFIRAYGSHLMGMGHLYRIKKLVDKIKLFDNKIEITLFTKKFNDAIPIYRDINYNNIVEISSKINIIEEQNLLKNLLKKEKFDICINDQLNTDIDTAKILTENTTNSITFDDLGEGNYLFDYIINVLYPTNQNLKNEINSFEYLILDDYFQIKQQVKFKEHIKTIFINQGAADTWGAIPDIIEDLNKLENEFKIKVLLGPSFKHYKELAIVLEKNQKQIELYNYVDSVVELVKDCDLAILGAGNTMFEVLSLGIPTIASTREKKELITIDRLLKEDLIYSENKIYTNGLENIIKEVISNTKDRKRKFQKNRKIFTYNGLDKIIKLILKD